MLESIGYTSISDISSADLIVFNTCCIRDTAETKIMGRIGEVKQLKKKQPPYCRCCRLYDQQKGTAESLRDKFPFVNIILGTDNLKELPRLVKWWKRTRKSI
jgi:tRNA-2-methylthio-N6-dimethylallyladenosine synthase